jgi:hypothetical protein
MRRDWFMNMLGRPPFDIADGQAARKAGFLSSSTLLKGKLNTTIFKPCKTLEQCFEDKFTHNGAEITRRVFIRRDALGFTDATSSTTYYARDWLASDATRCRIFGVWLSDQSSNGINKMCPGTTSQTHYCCAVDMSVAPLFHLFQAYCTSVLSELDSVCNSPPLSKTFGVWYASSSSLSSSSSYPIFSRSKVESIVKQIRDSYYAIPKTGGSVIINLYMNLLNDLLNEFSPPKGMLSNSQYACMYACLHNVFGGAADTFHNNVCTMCLAVQLTLFITMFAHCVARCS